MAITLNGDTGITTPGLINTGSETVINLTTTGNTILGDASTDTLNVGNGGLVKDASGNVGIGRTPVNKLDIGTSFTSQSSTGINASAKSIRIGNGEAGVLFTTDINTAGSSSGTQTSSAQVGYTYFSSTYPTDFVIGTNTQTVASNLRFYNNNSEVMRLDSSGNLGLGVTPSAWRSTEKAIQIGSTGSISQISTAVKVSTNAYWNSSNQAIYLSTSSASLYLQNTGAHEWYTAPSGTAGNAITFTQAMTLDASGNLGIGTASPILGARFEVAKTGGTTAFLSSVWNGVTDFATLTIQNTKAGTASTGTQCNFLRDTGVVVGTITSTTASTAYTTSSDYRLKENIVPMIGALDTVAKLKPVTYNWIEDGSDGQGFIAHELAEVAPDCVVGQKDATQEQAYEISPAIPAVLDEEGNEVTPAVEAVMGTRTVPVYQGIDTSFLVATLTAAIQELKAELDITKAKVAALEAA
jgi:hypothetical protein